MIHLSFTGFPSPVGYGLWYPRKSPDMPYEAPVIIVDKYKPFLLLFLSHLNTKHIVHLSIPVLMHKIIDVIIFEYFLHHVFNT